MFEKNCRRCGNYFEANTKWAIICPDCKQGKRQTHKPVEKPFEVIRCPVDELGVSEFPLRARFSRIEVIETVGMRHFPTGMVFQARGKVFEVRGKYLFDEEGNRVRAWKKQPF